MGNRGPRIRRRITVRLTNLVWVANRNSQFERIVKKIFDSNDISYLIYNYLGVALNLVSGIILARSIGADSRGALAYCMVFIAMANYASSLNLSNGMSLSIRHLSNNYFNDRQDRSTKRKIILAAFGTGIIVTCIVGFSSYESVTINSGVSGKWYLFALLPSSFTAFNSIVEGIMRVNGDTQYFRVTRLLGLATPSIFIFFVVYFDKTQISLLIFSNAVAMLCVTSFALVKYAKAGHLSRIELLQIYKYAARSFPFNFLDFMAPWAIYLVVLHTDGKAALGNFAIAMSFYSLSDSIFANLESKSHTFLGKENREFLEEQKFIFRVNLRKMIILKSIFIPFAFMISIIYGSQYRNASYYAVILLIIGFPLSYIRYINTISVSRNLVISPAIGQLIYLVTLILIAFSLPRIGYNFGWVLPAGLAAFLSASFAWKFTSQKYIFNKVQAPDKQL